MRMLRCLVAFALVLIAVPATASAQDGTITGTVVEEGTQRPLVGAQVTVLGTTLGSLVNEDGRFMITGVPAGTREVRAVLIGYAAQTQTVSVVAGQTANVEFALGASAVALDEIVVTGTVGQQTRRAQSAVVSTVNAEEIAETSPVTSVTDMLQARAPGISITQSSGSSGTAQRIRLRGQASINLSNEPLVYIDGVRADSRTTQLYGVGGQVQSRLNDIDPETIESIEVIKGPAAATLYGADASAGVIQIITKKGAAGAGFTQNVSVEYNQIEADYTPPANWGVCSQAVIDAGYPACQGVPAGTAISDRPSDRYDVFRDGQLRSVNWSGRGGGEDYGYYLMFGADDEEGTLRSNAYERMTGRFNFNFVPTEKLRMDAGVGLIRTATRLPNNDNNIYGYLGGIMLGSPLTVGLAPDGWYASNRQVEAISNIDNSNKTIRATPQLTVSYQPISWFQNELTVGADITRTEHKSEFPLNREGWYGTSTLNSGSVGQARENRDVGTVDYRGTLTNQLTDSWRSSLSFGTQLIATRRDLTFASGNGFTTRAANSINAAASTSGGQSFSEEREMGVFAQWQPTWRDRLYLQFAGRLDKSSTFGGNAEWFFSPKVGASYVVSDEAFWQDNMPDLISTLRLRGAYGTTGRSPGSGASLTTFGSNPYAITSSDVESGVTPINPGNPDLRPERGEEYEFGVDLGAFNERLGLEVTYFKKTSKDLILERPIAPSLGFSQDPDVNIGELINSGFEVAANLSLLEYDNLGWFVTIGFNTLHNEVTDLGDIEPIGTTLRVVPGYQVYSRFTRRIESINLEEGFAVVSDTTKFIGNSLPTFEGTLASSLSLFRNLEINTQLNTVQGFVIYNNTDQFRERQFGTGERWVLRDELPAEERITRFGPFVDSEGNPVDGSLVDEAYIERGDYVRLRELTLTYRLPASWASRFGGSGASVTLGGRNLALWTDYKGADPEVLGANTTTSRTDFLTLPQSRRLVARVNVQF